LYLYFSRPILTNYKTTTITNWYLGKSPKDISIFLNEKGGREGGREGGRVRLQQEIRYQSMKRGIQSILPG